MKQFFSLTLALFLFVSFVPLLHADDPAPQLLGAPLTAGSVHSNAVGPNETTACGSTHTIPTAAEQQIITLTNQLRQQNGVPPLAASGPAEESADTHSVQMATTGLFAHDSYGATLARTQSCGSSATAIDENIAGNGSGDPTATFNQYVNSPEHKANLLDPSMVAVGVSFREGIYNDGTTVWQNFWMNTMTFVNVSDGGSQPTPTPTPSPATLTATVNGPISASVNTSVNLSVSGTGAVQPYYLLAYGDGQTSNWQQSNQFQHTYTNVGAYAVTGYLGDGATGRVSAPASRTLTITQQPAPTPTPQQQMVCASSVRAPQILIFPC